MHKCVKLTYHLLTKCFAKCHIIVDQCHKLELLYQIYAIIIIASFGSLPILELVTNFETFNVVMSMTSFSDLHIVARSLQLFQLMKKVLAQKFHIF